MLTNPELKNSTGIAWKISLFALSIFASNTAKAQDLWIYKSAGPYEYYVIDRDSISSLRGESPYPHYYAGGVYRGKNGDVFYVTEELEDACLNENKSGVISKKVYESGGDDGDNVIHSEQNMLADRKSILKNRFRMNINKFVCSENFDEKFSYFKKMYPGDIRDRNLSGMINHLMADEKIWVDIISSTPRRDVKN